MKAKQFNENYTIDRTKNGLRAVEKSPGARRRRKPEIYLTKNGQPYNPEREYFFYDEQFKDVKSSKPYKQMGEFIGTFGLRVAPISELRAKRDSALLDAQRSIRQDVESLQDLIAKLELQKTPESRNLKDVLIAKDAAES